MEDNVFQLFSLETFPLGKDEPEFQKKPEIALNLSTVKPLPEDQFLCSYRLSLG